MMRFSDCRVLDARLARALLAPLAARYEKTLSLPESGPVEVQLSLSFDADPEGLIRQSPPEPHTDFLRSASLVSVALQMALRVWLPWLWTSRAGALDNFATTAALLVYSCARAFLPRSRQCFSFDVLDDATPKALIYSVKRALATPMEEMRKTLVSLGHGEARSFAESRKSGVLRFIEKDRRIVDRILAHERQLVECHIRLASLRGNPRRREETETEIRKALGRLLKCDTFIFPAKVLEMEAAAARAAYLGLSLKIDCEISARSCGETTLVLHESSPAPSPDILRDIDCLEPDEND